ncbi:MAG TPA: monovalent cation/H(+) antiporter subunit G [Geomonas sp.]|nr:monovalent cation/H(+) antiporter subunit G [Geomonas sp.]
MSPDGAASTAVISLLALALLVCGFSALGLLVMKGFYNKLHYLAPPAVVATALVALAIVLQEGMGAVAIKAGLVLLVMVISNPILTFAAARANYLRELQAREKTERTSATLAPESPGPQEEG